MIYNNLKPSSSLRNLCLLMTKNYRNFAAQMNTLMNR